MISAGWKAKWGVLMLMPYCKVAGRTVVPALLCLALCAPAGATSWEYYDDEDDMGFVDATLRTGATSISISCDLIMGDLIFDFWTSMEITAAEVDELNRRQPVVRLDFGHAAVTFEVRAARADPAYVYFDAQPQDTLIDDLEAARAIDVSVLLRNPDEVFVSHTFEVDGGGDAVSEVYDECW